MLTEQQAEEAKRIRKDEENPRISKTRDDHLCRKQIRVICAVTVLCQNHVIAMGIGAFNGGVDIEFRLNAADHDRIRVILLQKLVAVPFSGRESA